MDPPLTPWERIALVGVLLAFGALAGATLPHTAATYDEPAHLAAGYGYLHFGDFRLNPEHPPLLKALAALPTLPLAPRFETDNVAWQLGRQWEVGRRFLFGWNDVEPLLTLARLPMLALGALLGLAVFAWARRLWGVAAGWLALVLCVGYPDVMAHARLVTTDVGLTLFVLLAVVALERVAQRATWPRILAVGACSGAALASKYSGLLLVPTLMLLAGVAGASREPWPVQLAPFGETALSRGGRRLLAWLGVLTASGGVALVVLWASYGFRAAVSPEPDLAGRLEWTRLPPPAGVVGGAVGLLGASGLVPDAWYHGLVRVLTHSEAREAFLHGAISPDGFPHFFAISFLVKTPLPLLLLVSLGLAVDRRDPRWRRVWPWLALPVLVYVLMTASRGINIGHRHLLPVYPFLFVAAGRAAAWAWSSPRPRSWRRALVAGLGAWCLVELLSVLPHPLAYFNQLAGGPAQGHRWLVDSSLDWGQDLPALRDWQRAQGEPEMRLAYFGTASPAAYGLDVTLLPGAPPAPRHRIERRVRRGDVVAVSATLLHGMYVEPEDRELMARLRAQEPIGRAGYSILVYRAAFDWP